jgi:predicted enzyme related to lactoylglutathione lyase
VPNPDRAQIALYAVDPARLAPFYVEVTGLQVDEEAHSFITLSSTALELHIVRVPEDVAATIDVSAAPARREDTPIKVSFRVSSIEVARATAERLGGRIDGAESEWFWRGEVHCDGFDPEGNVFQVRAVAASPLR